MQAPSVSGTLYIVPTPLGNLGDITLRALEVLRSVDIVYAEDTRVTGKLLAAFDISVRLERLDEAVMAARTHEVCERALAGESIAYCSDAGMPGVSDPGQRLIHAAYERGVHVVVLPGASAAVCAYVASGTLCPYYYFGGFFPRKATEQRELLENLRTLDAALVFYESPKRVVAALQVIAEVFPHRHVALCRELTKLHEEVARGKAGELQRAFEQREHSAGGIKGEIALVIDAPNDEERAELEGDASARARKLATELVSEGMRTKDIAKRLVEQCGMTRNAAYDIAMEAGCE